MLCSLCFKHKSNCTRFFIQTSIYPVITTSASHASHNDHLPKPFSYISVKHVSQIMKSIWPKKLQSEKVRSENFQEYPLKKFSNLHKASVYFAGHAMRPLNWASTLRVLFTIKQGVIMTIQFKPTNKRFHQ